MLAAVRTLNRLELVGETLRAALNAIAVAAPDWLRVVAPPEWHDRYDRRVEDMRLPDTPPKREAYAAQVGADGFVLLDALDRAGAPADAAALPEVAVLRRVWARHFERVEAAGDGGGTGVGARLRPVQGRGPADRVESPYDTEARFRSKRDTKWTGYMVHLTETCGEDMPRLVINADTTPANMHEAERTAAIHDALAAKGLAPSEHLVDSAYVSAVHLVAARTKHGIDLVGPGRPNVSWQSRNGGDAFTSADFAVHWDRKVARCPEGKESGLWLTNAKRRGPGDIIHVQFHAADCRPCPSRARCARARSKYQGRVLAVMPQPEHEALAAARAREGTAEGKALYAQRNGVEGTLLQAVRALPAPGTLPRPGEDRPARCRHRRGPQPRPHRGVARRTPARANPHLALRGPRRLMTDFANRVRSFDEVVQSQQTFRMRLALAVADAWPNSATT